MDFDDFEALDTLLSCQSVVIVEYDCQLWVRGVLCFFQENFLNLSEKK